LAFVGSYTHESAIGIRVYDASEPGGRLVELSRHDGIEHPSHLAVHPSGEILYAVSETAGPDGGQLVALGVDRVDGSLRELDRVPSQGAAPCYVSVDRSGRCAYVANYVSGTVAAYALEHDGRFGELIATHQHEGAGPTPRQGGPHAHCIVPGPAGDWVYSTDLGTDRVGQYVHDRHADSQEFRLVDELGVDPGAGPRHLVFHPERPVGFLVCELDSTIEVLGFDPTDGRLTRLGSRSTLPRDFAGESIAAEVRVHPNGRHVYVSNRGHDSIAVFGLDSDAEALELLGHVPSGGRTPRNFAVHPSGDALFVANQDSDEVVAFEVDAQTGVPCPLDVTYAVSKPVCVTFSEAAR
jgi:6-phosphogluconolactonase